VVYRLGEIFLSGSRGGVEQRRKRVSLQRQKGKEWKFRRWW